VEPASLNEQALNEQALNAQALKAQALNATSLQASEAAVATCRQLAAADPLHDRDLALALTRLSNRLSCALSARKALVAAEEAVHIFQRIADADPNADGSDLARALNVFALRLVEVGRRDKALYESKRSVSMRRTLVTADSSDVDGPTQAQTDLAESLETLSLCLRELGRDQESRNAATEADGIRARLRSSRTDHF